MPREGKAAAGRQRSDGRRPRGSDATAPVYTSVTLLLSQLIAEVRGYAEFACAYGLDAMIGALAPEIASATRQSRRGSTGVRSDERSGRIRVGRACSADEIANALRCGNRKSDRNAEGGLRAGTGNGWSRAHEIAGQPVLVAIAIRIAAGAICHVHGAAVGKRHLDGHACRARRMYNRASRENGEQGDNKDAHELRHAVQIDNRIGFVDGARGPAPRVLLDTSRVARLRSLTHPAGPRCISAAARPPKPADVGIRRYAPSTVRCIRFIKDAQRIGFSLERDGFRPVHSRPR